MRPAWEILCASGVPAGPIRPAPSGPLPATVAVALAELLADGFAGLDGIQCDCLLAWLRAFRHHWPTQFQSILGDAGRAALALLEARAEDPDRYLKLRRIAIENLAGSL